MASEETSLSGLSTCPDNTLRFKCDFSIPCRSTKDKISMAEVDVSLQNETDDELVRRCQAELPYQTRTFELLIARYQDRVFGKAYNIIKNRDETNDLTQDIFVKVFHALPQFRFSGRVPFSVEISKVPG